LPIHHYQTIDELVSVHPTIPPTQTPAMSYTHLYITIVIPSVTGQHHHVDNDKQLSKRLEMMNIVHINCTFNRLKRKPVIKAGRWRSWLFATLQ